MRWVDDEPVELTSTEFDLRELVLADARQLRLHLRPTDVVQVIRSTVANLAPAAEAQEVALIDQLPDNLPPVQANPARVAQVLHNLLFNGLRHTPPGGSVVVTAMLRDDAVEVSIANTGEGIASEHLPHTFERFWRADPARARPGARTCPGGTGPGLSVAQSPVVRLLRHR